MQETSKLTEINNDEIDEDILKKVQLYHQSQKKQKRIIIIFLFVAGLIILIFLLGGFDGFSSKNYSTPSNLNATCYYYSQRLVKEKLKSPKSAEFPKYSADFISRDGDTVTVSAYVNAENSFGATVKTNYIATIQLKNNEPVSGSVVLIE